MPCASCLVDWQQRWPGASPTFSARKQEVCFSPSLQSFVRARRSLKNTSANASKNSGFPDTAEEPTPRPLTPPEPDWEALVSRHLAWAYGCSRRPWLSGHWRWARWAGFLPQCCYGACGGRGASSNNLSSFSSLAASGHVSSTHNQPKAGELCE